MAITPNTVISECQRHLQDAAGVTWAEVDMFEYWSNSTYVLAFARPNSFSSSFASRLAAGSKQTIPAGDSMLLDMARNMGATGVEEGKVITKVDRWQFDMLMQHWHKGTGKNFTEHYSYDPEKSLTVFYVFPPAKDQSGSEHFVELTTVSYPTKINRTDQGIVTTDFATDDAIDLTGHTLVNGDRVAFTTTTTLPAGLALLTDYFVINAIATVSFEVSLTSGGAAVDITDDGTGVHTVNLTNKYTAVVIDEKYEPFIKEWLFYEMFRKETSVASAQRSQQHMQSAGTLVGLKLESLRSVVQKMEENK